MCPRSDAADARDDAGYLLNWSSLAELLEATQFWYLEVGIFDVPPVIEEDFYFAVPFQPGYGVNSDLFHPILPSSDLVAVFSSE
jgi:hypothetical protein